MGNLVWQQRSARDPRQETRTKSAQRGRQAKRQPQRLKFTPFDKNERLVHGQSPRSEAQQISKKQPSYTNIYNRCSDYCN